MNSLAISWLCGCSSMVEQKLPKLLTFAVFRHVPCKKPQKRAFGFKRLGMGCKK